MWKFCRSLQLHVGLCALLLVSAYVAFDLLDVDGSDFRAANEIALASLGEAVQKPAPLLAGGLLLRLAVTAVRFGEPARRTAEGSARSRGGLRPLHLRFCASVHHPVPSPADGDPA